jgi:hypothetical protein
MLGQSLPSILTIFFLLANSGFSETAPPSFRRGSRGVMRQLGVAVLYVIAVEMKKV